MGFRCLLSSRPDRRELSDHLSRRCLPVDLAAVTVQEDCDHPRRGELFEVAPAFPGHMNRPWVFGTFEQPAGFDDVGSTEALDAILGNGPLRAAPPDLVTRFA